MDLVHYAGWLTVYVIDMLKLPSRCPDVHTPSLEGNFFIQKTSHKFSSLAHGHTHEQQSAILKGDGGIIEIAEDELALKRWMLAGPEICSILNAYERKAH